MNEENLNENKETTEAPAVEAAEATNAAPATNDTTAAEAAPEEAAQQETVAEAPKPESEEPQIIIQKERGFAHYVGFALLCVLCIAFFFIPGIALTFGVSRLVPLPGAAAWIFSAILSFVLWLIFKLKIKGFKKSFYFYIGLCVVVFAILIAIEVLTEKVAVFSSIAALLLGGAA
ncbi:MULTISPECIES: hypothetical protein [unclassified Fibrobacter]|jgi:hypothetical protein|uniref:hypothetical protein n=1 Tax=unclassified Fibrobacter TaxID=2634177 RepID=UPI001566BB91|nr:MULTISPECIES: hypothetical protein [unclassified Fibrobacter]